MIDEDMQYELGKLAQTKGRNKSCFMVDNHFAYRMIKCDVEV